METTPEMEKHPLLEEQRNPDEPEPSLRELQQNVFKAQRAYMRAWSRSTSGVWHRRIMLGVTILLCSFMVFCMTFIATEALSEDDDWHMPRKVPLEAHIMSKCPDARDCLHDLILPAMQNVSHKVDFQLSYIGKNTEGDGVICKHGQEECLGNILELCAAHHYPNPKQYLGFTMCLSKSYEEIPKQTLVEDCALEHGISMQTLNDCSAAEAEGSELLRSSFKRSQEAGVEKSCTVRLNGDVRCIRDGGKWTDCPGGHHATDLAAEITKAWELEWNDYA